MIDRGFDIKDIVPDSVTVNIPPFLAGQDQLTALETEETMSIASVRIHLKRAIGRIRTYRILYGNLPNTLSSLCITNRHSMWTIDKFSSSIATPCKSKTLDSFCLRT